MFPTGSITLLFPRLPPMPRRISPLVTAPRPYRQLVIQVPPTGRRETRKKVVNLPSRRRRPTPVPPCHRLAIWQWRLLETEDLLWPKVAMRSSRHRVIHRRRTRRAGHDGRAQRVSITRSTIGSMTSALPPPTSYRLRPNTTAYRDAGSADPRPRGRPRNHRGACHLFGNFCHTTHHRIPVDVVSWLDSTRTSSSSGSLIPAFSQSIKGLRMCENVSTFSRNASSTG